MFFLPCSACGRRCCGGGGYDGVCVAVLASRAAPPSPAAPSHSTSLPQGQPGPQQQPPLVDGLGGPPTRRPPAAPVLWCCWSYGVLQVFLFLCHSLPSIHEGHLEVAHSLHFNPLSLIFVVECGLLEGCNLHDDKHTHTHTQAHSQIHLAYRHSRNFL